MEVFEDEGAQADEEHPEADVGHQGVVVVAEVEHGVAPMLSLNHTDMPEFSSQKAKNPFLSLKISFLVNPYTVRSGCPLKAALKAPKSSTEFGILSVPSLLLVFLEVWTTFSSRLERKCCILVLRVVPVSAMLLIS